MTPNQKKRTKLGTAPDWHHVACGCMHVLQEAHSCFAVATVNEGGNSRAGPPDEVLHEASYHVGGNGYNYSLLFWSS